MGHSYVTLSTLVASIAVLPATLAIAYRKTAPPIVTYALAHTAIAGFAVALAASPPFAQHTTGMLGKKPDGHIAFWGLALWWPYHVSLRLKLSLQRRISTEPAWNAIAPGWWLGSWVGARQPLPRDDVAILDCTCELPLRRKYHSLPYLNLPTWDTYAPTVQQIELGVKWAMQQRQAGREVYTHCAHGHGRSNVMLCASLVEEGTAPNFREAHKIVQRARPKAKLNRRQYAALLEWEMWRAKQGKVTGKVQ